MLRLGFIAIVHLRAGAEGLHRRPGADHHRRPGAQALLGVAKTEGDFFEQLWGLLTHLGQTQWLTLLVGLLSLVVVLACKRWFPVVPGSLVAVLLGIAASHASTWTPRGGHRRAHRRRAAVVGLPDVASADYLELAGRRSA